MSATQYGAGITYGGTLCTAPVYGVSSAVSGSQAGNITDTVEWTGSVELTSNIVIKDGGAVVIACDAEVISNQFTIVVEDGGILNTRGNRLPDSSAISSILVIT